MRPTIPVARGAAAEGASERAVSFIGTAPKRVRGKIGEVAERSSCAASGSGSSHGGRQAGGWIEGAIKYHVPAPAFTNRSRASGRK
jgi:hypothetical protein